MHPIYADTALRRLVGEYARLRRHNEARAYDEHALALAEGAIGLICIERFLRVILGPDATDDDAVVNLLEKATGQRLNAIDPPMGFAYLPDERGTNEGNRDFASWVVSQLRNPLLHGNYEQAARACNARDAAEYLAGDSYRLDLENIHQVITGLLSQFDERGERREATERTRENDEAMLSDARERLVHALRITAQRMARRR